MSLQRAERAEELGDEYKAGKITLEQYIQGLNELRAEDGLPPVHPHITAERLGFGLGEKCELAPANGVTSELTGINCCYCDKFWPIDVQQEEIDFHVAKKHPSKRRQRI